MVSRMLHINPTLSSCEVGALFESEMHPTHRKMATVEMWAFITKFGYSARFTNLTSRRFQEAFPLMWLSFFLSGIIGWSSDCLKFCQNLTASRLSWQLLGDVTCLALQQHYWLIQQRAACASICVTCCTWCSLEGTYVPTHALELYLWK